MNTTNLFVELMVTGVGVLFWLLLFAVALVGVGPLTPMLSLKIQALVPFLAVVYLLGVVFDRVAARVFEKLWTA